MVRDAVIPTTLQRDVISVPVSVHHGKDFGGTLPERKTVKLKPAMALDFAAGCLGGCAGVIVGHPLDTVKVKLQMQDYKNPMYRGTLDCFTKILKSESISGLYRGVCSPMAGVAVVNAIVFGVYGNVKRHMSDPDSLKSQFLAGSLAGLAQSIVVSPVELVKSRVQISNKYKGTWDCFLKTYKQEGVKGVFKGLGVTGARELLGCGFYFASYEAMTRKEPGERPMGTFGLLMAGGIAGTISWIFTYPLDVVKTRLQVEPTKYCNFFDCASKSIKAEGILCLSRGLTPTLIRAFPTNAVTFTVVTWVCRLSEMHANHPGGLTSMMLSWVESVSIESNMLKNHYIEGDLANDTSIIFIKEKTGVVTNYDSKTNNAMSEETESLFCKDNFNISEKHTELNSVNDQLKMSDENRIANLDIIEEHNKIQR